jgi:hypothetical protein
MVCPCATIIFHLKQQIDIQPVKDSEPDSKCAAAEFKWHDAIHLGLQMMSDRDLLAPIVLVLHIMSMVLLGTIVLTVADGVTGELMMCEAAE